MGTNDNAKTLLADDVTRLPRPTGRNVRYRHSIFDPQKGSNRSSQSRLLTDSFPATYATDLRKLNRALDVVARTRSLIDPATRAYIERRTAEGKGPREIRRCLKRFTARQIFRQLQTLMA